MKKSTLQTDSSYDRRDFLRLSAVGGLGLTLGRLGLAGAAPADAPESSFGVPKVAPIDSVRIGFVGVGGMGTNHLGNMLRIEGVEVRAICDIVEGKVAHAQDMVVKAGQPKPDGYTRGETDFQRLCQREDLDLVFTATPWEWHVPVCLAAMTNGKHAATEVPAAVTLEDCWQLVETAEKTGRHCVMTENCCYDRTELMILNMVRQGVLGELIHAEGGYLHDLRALKFSNKGEGLWRLAHSINRNGDVYPTHGLGPVAQCMNINRGNQFVRLVSMGSQSRGLQLFAAEKFGPDSPKAKQHYALSDMVTTLIQTAEGQTITINHDTDSPHPYSRDILVQGTKGIVRKYPEEKIYIEGRTKEHEWEPLESYREEFEHPLWKTIAERSKGAGHGGMDFVEDYRLIQALRTGTPTDWDVYDAAAWSAVSALSESSIAKKNSPVDFPDFTRGNWKNRPPLGIVSG
jgi:predicted dehydrogenase